MPRIPGTGVYEQPLPDVITATTIESTVYNAFVNDVETDLNAPRPITSGGTGANNAAEATTNLKAVSYGNAQTQTDAEKLVARTNIAAAPLDALAYSGMQVNGSMAVSQERGTSTTSTHLGYIIDNWILAKASTATVTAGQGSGLSGLYPGFQSDLYITVSAGGPATPAVSDFVGFIQRIEGFRIERLAWGTANALPITIGFWARHVRAGTYSVSIRNSANDRSYVTTYTQNISDAMEYKTVTIPGCTTGTWLPGNGLGLSINLAMAAGSTLSTAPGTWNNGNFVAAIGQVNAVQAISDIFRITGVVVVPGTQAPSAAQSPLIMRPYDQELLTCKRYWQKFGNIVIQTSAITSMIIYPVEFRALPTITGGGAGFVTSTAGLTHCVVHQTTQGFQTLVFDARL